MNERVPIKLELGIKDKMTISIRKRHGRVRIPKKESNLCPEERNSNMSN